MKKFFIVRLCLVLAWLLSFAACGGGAGGAGEKRAREGAQAPRIDTSPQDGGDYVRTERSSGFGRVERFSIRPEAFARRKRELTSQQARLLIAGGNFNTRAYVLDGYERAGTVVLEPHVFLRSGYSAGKVEFHEARNGSVLVDVAVALVDGLSTEIATGRGTLPLPPEFQVKDRDALFMALARELKTDPVFLAGVRCPESMKLKTKGGSEYAVSLKAPLKSCPLNTFFPAVLSFKREEWQSIALSLVEDGAIDLETHFNFSVPLTVEYAQFKLKKEALLRAVDKRLGSGPELHSGDEIAGALTSVMEEMERAFEFDAAQEFLARLKDEFLHDYFIAVEQPRCPNNLDVCYGRRGDWSLPQAGEYTFNVRREEYFGKPVALTSISKVSDSLGDKQEVLISAGTENPLEPPKTGELGQVFRTVHEGFVAELKFRQIGFGEVEFQEPKFERIPNVVCVDPYTLCEEGRWRCTNPNLENYNCRNECTGGWRNVCVRTRQVCVDRECTSPRGILLDEATGALGTLGCFCTDWREQCVESQNQCQGWGQVCDNRRVCDRLARPLQPALPYRTDRVSPTAPDFAWECGKFAQHQCDPGKWEDHWQRVTTWSLPAISRRLKIENFKAEHWENVISGLSLRFSWASGDGTSTLTCALKDMEHRIAAPDRLLIVLKNNEACSPFVEENRKPGFGPSISFINQIAFPAQFQCGTLWEDWQGERLYTCRLPDGSESSLKTTAAEDEARLARGEKLGIHKRFYPRVELQGQLRIVGSQIIGGAR